MRNIKDVLRLKYVGKLSHERIAVALGVSKGVVTKYAGLANAAGLIWEQITLMDEAQLHNRLINIAPPQSAFVLPDYGLIHQELRRKGMTLMLLWDEHVERHGPDQTHRYAQFCVHYREYAKSLKRTMRQVHRAGEKLFIDFAGSTVGLRGGERAHIFVAAPLQRAPGTGQSGAGAAGNADSGGSPASWPARGGSPTQCAQRRVHYGGRASACGTPGAHGVES